MVVEQARSGRAPAIDHVWEKENRQLHMVLFEGISAGLNGSML